MTLEEMMKPYQVMFSMMNNIVDKWAQDDPIGYRRAGRRINREKRVVGIRQIVRDYKWTTRKVNWKRF